MLQATLSTSCKAGIKSMSEKSKEVAASEQPKESDFEKEVAALPEEQQLIVRAMMTSFQMTGMNNPESNLAKQWRPEHIQSYLDGAREDMQNAYKDRQQNRWFMLAIVVLALFMIAFIILTLKDTPDVMEKILYAVGGLVTGLVGGYGFGKTKKDE